MNKFLLIFLTCTFLSLHMHAESMDSLALTPPMGWNSWNCFSCNINEAQIREIADLMVSTGMRDAGYVYLNIDDCWQVARAEDGTILVDKKNFPSGIKALADYIHSKGLKFGVYSCAGSLTCAGRPGSRGYQFQDARTYAEWGVDYLKYDWCFDEGQSPQAAYKTMRDALNATGRPIVFSICEWGNSQPWKWAKGIGHLWRTTGDIMGFFKKLAEGIKKTKDTIAKKLFYAFSARELDDEFYESLEEALLAGDVGVTASESVVEELKERAFREKIKSPENAKNILKEILIEDIEYEVEEYDYPLVILLSGVNGVGKTTAIGKLAHMFREQGKSVVIAAADTFRAAASEQLEVWGERAGVRVIRHNEGADPAAVVYDAVSSAKARGTDVVLVDTAGRLHNKKNLMEELKKICRVVDRELPNADFRKYLVLDATTGQNGVAQAEIFSEAIDLDGIVLTKLDGTAKGGVVIAISVELELPVLYVGVGEKLDDLIPFDAKDFVEALI